MLMGTVINLTVIAEDKTAAEQAVASTFAELERQIAIFNHRAANGPVANLNRDGELTNPPKELVEVLTQANAIADLTAGAFDVTIKPLVALYQKAQPDLPSANSIQIKLPLVDYRMLKFSSDLIQFTQPGMGITLDGIAKGYILDAGTAQLRGAGFENVLVEAGGDMMASGTNESQQSWKIGVQSPRSVESGILARFSIRNQAAATSGDYMQYFTEDMLNHHILHPKTGFSVRYLASATVIAPSCTQADALATALMVMKPERGLALVDTLENIDALLIGKNLEEYRSSGFKDR
jgi:thiamine biosynthesis lipoprotein